MCLCVCMQQMKCIIIKRFPHWFTANRSWKFCSHLLLYPSLPPSLSPPPPEQMEYCSRFIIPVMRVNLNSHTDPGPARCISLCFSSPLERKIILRDVGSPPYWYHSSTPSSPLNTHTHTDRLFSHLLPGLYYNPTSQSFGRESSVCVHLCVRVRVCSYVWQR